MNLILLFDDDFFEVDRVRLEGRRLAHVESIHRASVGDELCVGRVDGLMGRGRVSRLDNECLEMEVVLDQAPPPKLPLHLVLALPRPKVLNRVIASATSLGVSSIHLINAWKVEKSYWKSPRLSTENLREQCVLGLEQAKDTILPDIQLHRLLRPFAEDELPRIMMNTLALVAHPYAERPCPRHVSEPVTLAIGPEGGFIPAEIDLLARGGFAPISMGERILRVETAVAALISKLY